MEAITESELHAEREALIEIAGKCLAALDPELERRVLVAVIRDIYAVSSDFPSPDDPDDDYEGDDANAE